MAKQSEDTRDALVLAKRVGKAAFVLALKAERQRMVDGIVLHNLNSCDEDSAKKVIKTGLAICALLAGVDKVDALLERLG